MESNPRSKMDPHLSMRLVKSRWFAIAAAIWIQCCSGNSYNFGLYSQQIKHTLQYNQEELDTIAVFKDIGANVGIVAGVIVDLFPPWIVIFLGVIMSSFGYTMVWLALTERITAPSLWNMCVYILLATNGQTFFNSATIVTSVHNFPSSRGTVIGLLKGFLGLSGAIFAEAYSAMFQEYENGYPLLAACIPSVVCLIFIFILRPLPPIQDDLESANFYLLSTFALILGGYLTGIVVVKTQTSLGHTTVVVSGVIAFVLILLPLVVVFKSEMWDSSVTSHYVDEKKPLLRSGSESCSVEIEQTRVDEENGNVMSGVNTTSPTSGIATLSNRDTTQNSKLGQGEDLNLMQSLFHVNFWLLFAAMASGMGSGLTIIDNMGQIGDSLGYTKAQISTIISMLSILNFLGRLLSGTVSEFFLHGYHVPRTLFLVITQAGMCAGFLIMSSGAPGSLYAGLILVASGYGSQWSLMPAITSEIFGLRHFGTLFNSIAVASPIGSYFLSVQVFGYIFDREAGKGDEVHKSMGLVLKWFVSNELLCHGIHCFRLTFIIMAVVSLVGCIVSLVLFVRTKTLYEQEICAQPGTKTLDAVEPGQSSLQR